MRWSLSSGCELTESVYSALTWGKGPLDGLILVPLATMQGEQETKKRPLPWVKFLQQLLLTKLNLLQ